MKNNREQAEVKVKFRTHLITYIAVIGLLALINLLTSPEHLWFIWPLLGWGIGIFVHALTVYFSSGEPSH